MSDVKDEVVAGYGVVVLKNKEVLLVRHLEKAGHVTDTYGLPAGRATAGETPQETAKRELFEETGLKVEKNDMIELPNVYSADIPRSDGSIRRMSIECYLATKTSGTLARSVDEETEPEWVQVENLSKINLLPNVDKLVTDALKIRSML